jgi:malate dehydrogenase (oxaloacetate-decarboxylating)(NADP+)
MQVLVVRNRVFFFADPVVNIHPSAEELAEIASLAAEVARDFGFEPRIAMLSYSNFGTSSDEDTARIQRALEILREKEPDLVADGEMQADTAVVPEILQRHFPFSRLNGQEANVLMGLSKPVHLLQPQSDDSDIVNVTAIAVVESERVPAKRP